MRPSGTKVTVYEVARSAGVSISTVSLAINHPHRVAEPTRQRVLEAAARLGFRGAGDHPRAGRLRIAVAAPFSSYPSYGRRLLGVLAAARRTATEVVVHDLDSAAAVAEPLLEALPARSGIDGLVVMGVPLRPDVVARLDQDAPPVVLVDVHDLPRRRQTLPVVLADDEEGGRVLGEHLAEHGHRRVVFLHEPQESRSYVSAGLLRSRGLGAVLDVVECPVPDDADPDGVLDPLLEGTGAPTAVVANHDALAARAHRALRRRGTDVALAGFDDGPLAESLDLTTVRQQFEESGRLALDLLRNRIAGTRGAVERVVLRGELVPRRSTLDRPAG